MSHHILCLGCKTDISPMWDIGKKCPTCGICGKGALCGGCLKGDKKGCGEEVICGGCMNKPQEYGFCKKCSMK
jgi:hypothetical protein